MLWCYGKCYAMRYDNKVNDDDYPGILIEDDIFRFSDQVKVNLGTKTTFEM